MPAPRLDPQRSALLVIDLQERIMPVIHDHATCIRRAARLAQAADVLRLPRLVTEQYPRGLGATVPEVARHLDATVAAYEDKTCFSACVGQVRDALERQAIRSVVLCGVEAHICVLFTALDLIDHGYTVAVCDDAVGSRRPADKAAALRRMTQAGVIPTTVESVLYELAQDAASDRYKALKPILQSKAAD